MFTELHVHSEGSNTRGFLDSINQIPDMVQYARELGHRGMALTDHDTITMHLDLLDYIKDLRDPNSKIYGDKPDFTPEDWEVEKFKVILGNEISLCSRKEIEEDKKYKFYHFILLAKDAIGHKQIRELSTRAWTDNSFVYVKVRTPTFYDDLFEVVESDRGHLIASTACLGGKLSELILKAYNENPENPDYKLCKKWILKMDKCFGHGNFFLEMQPSHQEDQIIVNNTILKLSKELDVPYIITTDAHYLKKEDRYTHEIFLKSNEDEGKDRETGEFYATTYFMSEEEIHEYMDKYIGRENVQKGIDNTNLIWDMVEEYSLEQKLNIPYEPTDLREPDVILYNRYKEKIELLKDFYESEYPCDRHLVRNIVEKIESCQEELANDKTYDAINTCLKVIKNTSDKMGTQWSAYLLQTRAFVDTIWEAGSLCGPSRGSGGGFILLYILGIIQINPLRETTRLYYWRFLHEFRASPLDIDLDCEGAKRDTIIQILQEKYGGIRRVAKVQTILRMKSKNAIISACRGLGIPNEEAQYLSSFIGAERGIQYTLKQVYYGDAENGLSPNMEFVHLMRDKYPEVWEVASKIEGLISGVGQHAGGVILTPSDITDYCALMRVSSGDIVTQFDLHKAEKTGQFKASNI